MNGKDRRHKEMQREYVKRKVKSKRKGEME